MNWKSFLQRHYNTSQQATQGLLKTTPYNWVSSIQEKENPLDFEQSFTRNITGFDPRMTHYSGLVPSKLAENAISLKTGKKTENSSELKEINLFKFSGGGNEFAFELDRNDVKSHTEKLSGSSPIQNSEGYSDVGFVKNTDIEAFASLGIALEG